MLFAAIQPLELRPFLLVVGVPLFISPLTATITSSWRILKFVQRLGMFADDQAAPTEIRLERASVSSLPRSTALADVIVDGTGFQHPRSSKVTSSPPE